MLSKLLLQLADDLESTDNAALISAEEMDDPAILNIVAEALSNCSSVLKDAAEKVKLKEKSLDVSGHELKEYDTDGVEIMAVLATAYDESNDPELIKVASLLDEILLSIGAPKNSFSQYKIAEETELDKLRKKYRAEALEAAYGSAKKELDKQYGIEEATKQIESKIKQYRPMEHPLSTRYSPDMPGVSLIRIGDNVYQCPVTKKIYNYEVGYTLMDGDKVPGTNVSNQTQQVGTRLPEHVMFGTRESILNGS